MKKKEVYQEAVKRFLNQFERVYAWLYDKDITMENSEKFYYFNGKYLPEVFDEIMNQHGKDWKFFCDVAKERGDFFSSDREAAAVCITALQFHGIL